MKYILGPALIALFSLQSALALEVDVDELKSARRIRFINYTGRVRKQETPREVGAIGRGLARQVQAKKDGSTARFFMKYSMIHAVSKDEPEKLSADIFSIDRDARVSHITNVRRIIAGYFEEKYDYSPENAWTLAVFVTYYNAVYRGSMDYFSSKYKRVVTDKINRSNAGMSTRYSEWPGRTRILIPLTEEAKRGRIGTVDAFAMTDKKVREAVRKDDRNIEERKKLTEIKEKGLDEEKKKLAEDKKRAEKERGLTEEKKKELEKEKARQEKEREALEKEKKRVAALEDEKEKKKERDKLAEKEKKLDEEKKKTAEERKKLAEKEKQQDKEKERIAEKEKKLEEKKEQVKEEKKEIAEDEKKRDLKKEPEKAARALEKKAEELEKKEKDLDRREDALKKKDADKNIFALKLYYLKIKEYLEGGHYNNDMYMINAATRKVEFKSPVENICGSRYDVYSGGIVVITHRGNHRDGHRLTMLDRETLAAKTEGKDDVSWRSFVEIRDGFIYVVAIVKGEYYLGKYNERLERVAISKEKVAQDTFISFFQEYIYINSRDKKILVLKKDDLSLVDTVDPETAARK